MDKMYVLILCFSIAAVHTAVVQNKDASIKRIKRSPCDSCDDDGPPFPPGPYGPPFPPGLYGPPPPPPPPPDFFQARQWSGVGRHGHHYGVFSGASAAIGGGSQATSSANSLASNVNNDETSNFDYGGKSNAGGSRGNSQSSSSSQSGFGDGSSSNSQSASSGFRGESAAQSNAQSSSSFEGHSRGNDDNFGGSGTHSGGKYAYQEFQSSQSGNLDDKGHIQSEHSSRGFSSDDTHASNSVGFSGDQQETARFGGSGHNSGSLVNSQQQSIGFRRGGQQTGGYEGSQQQQSVGFGGSGKNSDRLLGGQQQSVGFNGQQSGNYGGGQQQSAGFSSSQHQSGGYGSAEQSGSFQQQATRFGSSGQSSQSGRGYDSGSSGTDYYNSQAALKGAFNLADHGLDASGQSGCSTCGKNSLALSNAKSDSGNAVAVSVSG